MGPWGDPVGASAQATTKGPQVRLGLDAPQTPRRRPDRRCLALGGGRCCVGLGRPAEPPLAAVCSCVSAQESEEAAQLRPPDSLVPSDHRVPPPQSRACTDGGGGVPSRQEGQAHARSHGHPASVQVPLRPNGQTWPLHHVPLFSVLPVPLLWVAVHARVPGCACPRQKEFLWIAQLWSLIPRDVSSALWRGGFGSLFSGRRLLANRQNAASNRRQLVNYRWCTAGGRGSVRTCDGAVLPPRPLRSAKGQRCSGPRCGLLRTAVAVGNASIGSVLP